ncbi:MAG: protease pro-enzyme activation domain-containing protein [Terriglobales bacterium]
MRSSCSTLLSLSHLSLSKPSTSKFSTPILCTLLCILIFSTLSFAAAPDRISGPIVSGQNVKLSAGIPLKAQPQYDQGRVDPSLRLGYMTLLTVPSASQQKAIDQLLAQQQNPHSPLYHKWLTPEQYADRFGLSRNDIQKLSAWLQSQGFAIVRVARGRNFIVFSGTAAQAESVFQTEIHNFEVKGEKHFSNITPISIPAALSGVVAGVRGLSNFPAKSHAIHAKPAYTEPGAGQGYWIAPGDITAMYDLQPLYTAGIDGNGQTLAVMGETDLYLADLNDFRTIFDLPQITGCTFFSGTNVIETCSTTNFKYVVVEGQTDPGSPDSYQSGDLLEADIDLEYSNAVAQQALILYVNAPDDTGNGVWDSWYYAVDQDLAPVITLSYGNCELGEALYGAANPGLRGTFALDEPELKKANLLGITFMNSTGDTAAVECDPNPTDPNGILATGGLAVSYPASSPEVTGVGGTMIPYTEYTSAYWSASNGSAGGSAIKYIPEQGWNDAQEWGLACVAEGSDYGSFCDGITSWETAQESANIGITGGGGGLSNCVNIDNDTGICDTPPNGGFAQPTWQASLAVPGQTTAGVRFSPDVSLIASVFWPGFIICSPLSEVSGGTDTTSICASGISGFFSAGYTFGGTSFASPMFAGMVTLLNQYLGNSGTGLGNLNPTLYTLAAATPTNGAFNQVKVGSNGAYCETGTPAGQPAALQCPSSSPFFIGFDASDADPTTGYNLVTGLGSVDANNLAVAARKLLDATTTALQASPTQIFLAQSVTLTATVTPSSATGTVSFYNNGSTTALGSAALSSGVATFSTTALPLGTNSIVATYNGNDASSSSSAATVTVLAAPTFTLSAPNSPAAILAGESTTSTFTVTPGGGTFAAAVTFACNNLPDATVGCSASPIAEGATGVQTVTLMLTTAGPNTSDGSGNRRRKADNRSPWLPLALPLAGIVMAGFAGRRVSRYSAIAGLCVSLVLLGLLLACGGSSSPPVAISVSPSGATVWASDTADGWPPQTATFNATVTNTNNTAVSWAVTTTNGGSITSGGVYTAPTAAEGLPTSATITATSQADSTKTASATVTITPTTVPGAYPITVTATEGPTANTTSPFTLTVH